MINLKKYILKISLVVLLAPSFVNFNLKAVAPSDTSVVCSSEKTLTLPTPELSTKELRTELNDNLKVLTPAYDSDQKNNIDSNEILAQIKFKRISAELSPGWSVRLSNWFRGPKDLELLEKIKLFQNFQFFENQIKDRGYSLYSRNSWNAFVENVEKYTALSLASKIELKNPVATKINVPDELEILQTKIDKQAQDILSMFQEDVSIDKGKSVAFTDFLGKQDSLRSDISKVVGFFTKVFKRPSFELELLKKISELKSNVFEHASKTSGNATFVSSEKWNELEQLLECYLKMKSAKDEKSKSAYAKKILSFPLKALFGQTIKTNSYGGWALDKCIRLSMICLVVGTLAGSYNWWCTTEIGFVGGFLLPFKIVKNVSVFGYVVLKFFASKITQPYGDLTWNQEYARQLGAWLWSFIGS